MDFITVNGKECEIPEDANIRNIVRLYSDIDVDYDPFFAVVNGKTINSIIDGTGYEVKAGDVIEIHPLVIGG